jgi:hypothetical protein
MAVNYPAANGETAKVISMDIGPDSGRTGILTQLAAKNLTQEVFGQLTDDLKLTGTFVFGEMLLAEAIELLQVEAIAGNHIGDHDFTSHGVGFTDYRSFGNVWVS